MPVRAEGRSRESTAIAVLVVSGLLAVIAACGGDDDHDDGGDGGGEETTLFPADYAETYVEVRDCRMSIEHAMQIRVLADADALVPYREREEAFPEGAVVLKEEYEFGGDCTGPIVQWTAMKRAAAGSADDTLGWTWEKVDAGRNVVETDGSACIACHTTCGLPPEGYEGTCAVP